MQNMQTDLKTAKTFWEDRYSNMISRAKAKGTLLSGGDSTLQSGGGSSSSIGRILDSGGTSITVKPLQ